jgi:hypothetical protein
MSLNESPLFSYPRDPLTRFGFIIGDSIAWAIIVLIAYIALKSTLHF